MAGMVVGLLTHEQTDRTVVRQIPLWLFRRMVLVVVWYRLSGDSQWEGGEGHLSAESSSGWNYV